MRTGNRKHKGGTPRRRALKESPPAEAQISSSLPMERLMRVIRKAAEGRDFRGTEDLDAYLAGFTEQDYNRAVESLKASGPRDHALQLAYEAALDSQTDDEALELARRALELDPECTDAAIVVAEITCGDRIDELIGKFEQAADTARRNLGEKFFEELEDSAWDTLEARPYLRAAYRLADALRVAGRTAEAARRFEDVIELDPGDAQRVRDPLLSCYLAADDLGGARDILTEFEFDRSAVFLWGRALERYLSGDTEGAWLAVKKARRQNRHAERYMSFRASPPAVKADYYTPGGEDEAIHCLYIMAPAWVAHPEAISWLRSLS